MGQRPSIIPDCARAWVPYHLSSGAVRLLLGPGLCLGLIPPGSWEKSESPHFRPLPEEGWRDGYIAGSWEGWSQTLLGSLAMQDLVFCSLWPPAHLFCALVTYESPPQSFPGPQSLPGTSLLSCWHSGLCSTGSGALVWDHPFSPLPPSPLTSQSCLQAWDSKVGWQRTWHVESRQHLGFGFCSLLQWTVMWKEEPALWPSLEALPLVTSGTNRFLL